MSVFAVCTEKGAVPLEPARDYKRLLDGGEGPNTGGMGSYSPVDDLPDGLVDSVMSDVVNPTLGQMESEGTPFAGFLYVGLVSDGPMGPRSWSSMSASVIQRPRRCCPEWCPTSSMSSRAPHRSGRRWQLSMWSWRQRGIPRHRRRGPPSKAWPTCPTDVIVFQAGTTRDGRRPWSTVVGC